MYAPKDQLYLYTSKKIKINLKLKSFHKHNFKLISQKILKKIQGFGFFTTGFVSLPTKTFRYTVLRSPHVDKKSREQFELKQYSKILYLTIDFATEFEKQNVKLLLNFLKNSASGLSLQIKYIT